ncbi:hypothetical protein Tco_0966281 [Tanacetum coccineum]
MWAKQDHIRRQKQQRDNPQEVYSESKTVEVIRTSYELGHENKFITEIIVRRANEKIDPITKPDYKYLNKNDTEDLYLLSFNGKVKDYRETREKLFTITSEPVVGMIYENNKKEKGVMIHNEIHKFCDATLKRVLEKLKKYNKDVKYGYVDLMCRWFGAGVDTVYPRHEYAVSSLMDTAYWLSE